MHRYLCVYKCLAACLIVREFATKSISISNLYKSKSILVQTNELDSLSRPDSNSRQI